MSGASTPWGIGLDPSTEQLFFTNEQSVQHISIDGTGLATLTPTVVGARQIALDLTNSKMYWAAEGTAAGGADAIYRANLDGTGLEAIVTGLWNPRGIALDLIRGKVYFEDFILATSTRTIHRANLDGSGVEDIVVGETHGIWSLELDEVNQKLYWGDVPSQRVRRSNLDGTGIEDVLTGLAFGPLDIKVDTLEGRIYVAGDNPSGGGIIRSNLDGSDLETLFTGGTPTNIALGNSTAAVPEPSSLLMLGLTAVGFGTYRFRRRKRAM